MQRSRAQRGATAVGTTGLLLAIAVLLSGCGVATEGVDADHTAAAAAFDRSATASVLTSPETPATIVGGVTGVSPVPRASAPEPVGQRSIAFAVWAVDEVVAPVEGTCPVGTAALASPRPGAPPGQCFRRMTDGERLGPETLAGATPLVRGRGANRGWYVAVTLTPDGLTRLNQLATAVRLGRGQLAVEYDGRVLTAPMLTNEPYRDATIDITGDLDESVARTIAAGLTPV